MLYDYGHIHVTRFAVREMEGADVWPRKPTTPGDPDDETDIRVELPRSVAPGARRSIDLAWDADLPSLALQDGSLRELPHGGAVVPEDRAPRARRELGALPYHRLSEFYADFRACGVTVDVPGASRSGRPAGSWRSGGRTAERSAGSCGGRATSPSPRGTASASCAPRPATASRSGASSPGSEREAALEIDLVRFGLERFGAAFGRYPYCALTIVHPPEGAEEAGGMEHPTLITTGGSWLWPVVGVRYVEAVTVHELAHRGSMASSRR